MSLPLTLFILLVMMTILVLIQAGVNYALVKVIPVKYFTIYKYASYFIVIFLSLVPMVMVVVLLFIALSRSGTPDPGAVGMEASQLIRDALIPVVMISFQIVFNQIVLKRIALKRSK